MEPQTISQQSPLPPPPPPPYEKDAKKADFVSAPSEYNDLKKQLTPPEIPPLRTYESDVKDAIKENNTSVIQIALAEAKKKELAEQDALRESPKSPLNVVLIIASALFIIAGIGVEVFLFLRQKTAEIPPVATEKNELIIKADDEKNLDVTNLKSDALSDIIRTEMKDMVGVVGEVKTLRFFKMEDGLKKDLSAADFLARVAPHVPDEFNRSLRKDFVFGFFLVESNRPFLVFKTNSYTSAFAGLFSWEKDMADDLAAVLSARSSRSISIKAFEDSILSNKDTRILRGDDGKISFYYSFLDRETLLIATDERVIKEVSERLRAAKLIR